MDPDSLVYLILLAVALVGLAFGATAESALASLSRGRDQRLLDPDSGAANALDEFLDRPSRYLATTAIIRIACTIAAGVFGTVSALRLSGGIGPEIGILALALGVLVVGHVLPRAVATNQPGRVALALSLPIRALAFVLGPFVRLIGAATNGLSKLLSHEDVREGSALTQAEMRENLAAAEEEGLIEEDERDMIDGIFDMEETMAREIMVPRMDIVALQADATASEAIDVIIAQGCSRMPVFEESIDHVVGVLYAKDLFPLVKTGDMDKRVRDLVRPAYFIPESKRIDELLHELQQKKVHIAIVVDEYGGTAGLVTIEDLLEEIVGEIQDEFDLEEDKIVTDGGSEAMFDATVSINDVNHTLELTLRGDEVETIGGLVYEKLGRVPQTGDTVTLDEAVVSVLSTSGRRIKKVKVAKRPKDEGSPSAV